MSNRSIHTIVEKPETYNVTRFEIVNMRVRLFQTADVSVDLFSQNKFLRNEIITLTEEEYNAWISDDDIVNIVLDRLGFQLLTEETSADASGLDDAESEPTTDGS
jgi:hypothetical protein